MRLTLLYVSTPAHALHELKYFGFRSPLLLRGVEEDLITMLAHEGSAQELHDLLILSREAVERKLYVKDVHRIARIAAMRFDTEGTLLVLSAMPALEKYADVRNGLIEKAQRSRMEEWLGKCGRILGNTRWLQKEIPILMRPVIASKDPEKARALRVLLEEQAPTTGASEDRYFISVEQCGELKMIEEPNKKGSHLRVIK